jgi:hypothetical protein
MLSGQRNLSVTDNDAHQQWLFHVINAYSVDTSLWSSRWLLYVRFDGWSILVVDMSFYS